MGYQWGWSGYLTYHQDNSGYTTNQSTTVTYTLADVGIGGQSAPPRAVIQTGLYNISTQVARGSGGVGNPIIVTPEKISFVVWTVAADTGLFGHRAGEVTVTTWFGWYDANTATAVPGLEMFFFDGPPKVLPNEAPAIVMPFTPIDPPVPSI